MYVNTFSVTSYIDIVHDNFSIDMYQLIYVRIVSLNLP